MRRLATTVFREIGPRGAHEPRRAGSGAQASAQAARQSLRFGRAAPTSRRRPRPGAFSEGAREAMMRGGSFCVAGIFRTEGSGAPGAAAMATGGGRGEAPASATGARSGAGAARGV